MPFVILFIILILATTAYFLVSSRASSFTCSRKKEHDRADVIYLPSDSNDDNKN